MSNNNLLTPHFALQEFTECHTAQKYGIANEPPPKAIGNLRTLCEQILEPLREALGLPVVITSGYRCKKLNDRISHHAHHSQHLQGQAADFYVSPADVLGSKMQVSSRRELLIKAFRQIILDDNINYDQLILYPTFIHVSYVSAEANRHYIMTANGKGQYRRVSRDVALTIY